MLTIEIPTYYKVKKGQTVRAIATAFCVAERLLVKENGLTQEPFQGQLLLIPKVRGNAYTAVDGQTKALLCGNDSRFEERNGTTLLYPGMRVIL